MKRSTVLLLTAVVLLLLLVAVVVNLVAEPAVAHKTSGVLLGLSTCCVGFGGIWSAVSPDGPGTRELPPIGPVTWTLNRLTPAARRRTILVISVAIVALGLAGLYLAVTTPA